MQGEVGGETASDAITAATHAVVVESRTRRGTGDRQQGGPGVVATAVGPSTRYVVRSSSTASVASAKVAGAAAVATKVIGRQGGDGVCGGSRGV